jgi:N-methylhydantoinase B
MTEAAPDSSATDALELEIFRSAVGSIVDELELNLTRTALSELIYEYKDFSLGLLTRDFKLLAQSEGSIPLFVADLGVQVSDAVEVIGMNNLDEGDVFVSNYGPANGQHLNNVTCATPVFQEGQIVGYVAIRAHWTDIGGLAPGSMSWDARDIFQEGVQYRGLRVVRAGQVVPEVMATLQANSRLRHYVYGDAMAQIQACQLGRERWLTRVAAKWTVAEQGALIAAQAAQSARVARSAIASLPDGEYAASCRTDDAGAPGTDPLELKVRIVVEGERLVIDFSGTT